MAPNSAGSVETTIPIMRSALARDAGSRQGVSTKKRCSLAVSSVATTCSRETESSIAFLKRRNVCLPILKSDLPIPFRPRAIRPSLLQTDIEGVRPAFDSGEPRLRRDV